MRNELENIEMIERYLLNEMTAEERNSFEIKMNGDATLREAVKVQRELMKGMNRIGLKKSIAKAKMKYNWFKNGTSFGLGAVIVTGLTVGVMWVAGSFSETISTQNTETNNSLPQLNENGDTTWADADKYLPVQKFSINTTTDTVIETSGGIVMVIPANTFLDENENVVNGTVEYEVKEALDAASIIEAGLETKSGDQLLETGGMFYINARQNGKSLKIDASKGIYTEVPANEIKAGMQLFDGVRKADGGIDWVNPKPLEKELTAVNILDLNFYPPKYLNEVGKLGHDNKNKKFTDSLYYSFADLFGDDFKTVNLNEVEVYSPAVTKEIEINNNNKYSKLSPDNKVTANNVTWDCEIIQNDKAVVLIFGTKIKDGWFIFSQSQPNKNGPVPTNFNFTPSSNYKSILYKLSEGDSELKYLEGFAGKYNIIKRGMPFTDQLIVTSATDFILKGEIEFMQCDDNGCLPPTYIPFQFQVKGVPQNDSVAYANDTECQGINPSKIKAIWNEEFQNTNLATREFEERLKTIHGTCDNSVLDIYVNNMDKNLSTVDSMAAQISGGHYSAFMYFAARGDGKVKAEGIHQKKLKEYYERKSREYTAEVSTSAKDYKNNNNELLAKAEAKIRMEEAKNMFREENNFNQELEMNMDEAYRQLGKKRQSPNNGGGGSSYRAVVTTPGWKNVDQYVLASTENRETLDYTDPQTGKKAIIKYEKMIAKISAMNDFDRLLIYLLPDQLTSFMRMKFSNNQYEEKLNELMKYDLVCVGYKKDQPFYFVAENVSPKTYADISLQSISRNELNHKLNQLKNVSSSKDVINDLDYTDYQISEEKRLKKIKDTEELRNLLMPVVFPCVGSSATDTTAVAPGTDEWTEK